jgi:hypothetical protein
MSLLKIIFSICLFSLLVNCSKAPEVNFTSTLKPDSIEEMTDDKQLATKMFTSITTRLPNGMLSATIQQENPQQHLNLTINHTDKTLHELCPTQENCVGGVYSSVHNKNGQGEIFHRVFKGKNIQIACAWVEHYSTEFGSINEQLQQDVIGRSWHWVKECFEE